MIYGYLDHEARRRTADLEGGVMQSFYEIEFEAAVQSSKTGGPAFRVYDIKDIGTGHSGLPLRHR